MSEKYQVLKAAALAATPGPWNIFTTTTSSLVTGIVRGRNGHLTNNMICKLTPAVWRPHSQMDLDAKFIALANPAAVLELVDENQYMRVKIKEMDLLFGGLLLTMQAAVIEQEHGEGPAAAMQWIFNKLLGPGEFAPDSEKDAQAYFNRKSEEIDAEFNKCMEYFTARNEAKKLVASKTAGGKS
jgi:hypothetical protein